MPPFSHPHRVRVAPGGAQIVGDFERQFSSILNLTRIAS
jgi:hypothetical protein